MDDRQDHSKDLGNDHQYEQEHEHTHGHGHKSHGPVHRAAFTLSMLFCRGGMARTIADLAGLSASDVVVDVGCGPAAAARRARREGGPG